MANTCPKCNTDNPDTLKFCGECGTQLPSLEGFEVTETIETPKEELTRGTIFADRYEIIEELGKGGMGRVYRVEDTKLKQEVALKLIKPEIAKDKKTIERFRNELKLARNIRHKNVCGMFDLGEEAGTHFITMEYISGEDLKSFIHRSGQLAVGTSVRIAKQVCEGLSEAHKLGVVHRDLKSNNIMIDKAGNARIMDFGIARSLESKSITGAGVMIGTPEYMSPEQVEGKGVDQRSDIYSLGVILYEMMTGRVPFEGDTALSIAMKHKGEAPKDPKEYNTQIPDDLSKLILKCLEKEKEDRYQDAEEVKSELANIEQGIPTTDRVVPRRKPITSKELTVTIGFKRLAIPTLVVMAIAVIGLVIWSPWAKKELVPEVKEKPSIAVLPFVDLSPQGDQEHLCDGMTSEIITKLSRLQGWKVMNTDSVMRLKNTEKDVKQIGQELDVATILYGRVRKEAENLRVDVQLVNAEDGFQLWSETYEQKLDRVFAIQSDVAQQIAQALKVELTSEEKDHIQERSTENLEAYEKYLKGQYFQGRRNEKDIRDSIEYFEEAIELDPNFALAYSDLAFSLLLLPLYSSVPIDEVRHKIIDVSQKALKLDPMIPEAHTALGSLYRVSWEWDKAEAEFKKAIELNPNDADAYHMYAWYLLQLARYDEAIENMNMAIKLDPLSLIINQNQGELYYYSRKYDKSIEATKRTIEMDPAFPQAHYLLGMAYLAKGMYEEAMEEFQLEKNLPKPFSPYSVDSAIGVNYAKQGMQKEAEEILKRLMRESLQTSVPPRALAILCFALGKNDEGLDFLEAGYVTKDSALTYLRVDPRFDSVRTNPRFIKLLEKVGLN